MKTRLLLCLVSWPLVLLVLGKCFQIQAATEPYGSTAGHLQLFSGPQAEFDVVVTIETNGVYVEKVPRQVSNSTVSVKRHYTRRLLDWHYKNFRYLTLITDSALDFYVYDPKIYHWTFHTSVQLPTALDYIVQSAREDPDSELVVFANQMGYSELFIDDLFLPVPEGSGIVLSCHDGIDVVAQLQDGRIQIDTVSNDYPTSLTPSQVRDCAVFTKLHPLNRTAKATVFFTAVCLTNQGVEKHFYIVYPYTQNSPAPESHVISVGTPLDQDEFLAVVSGDLLFMYNVTSWDSNFQAINRLPSEIKDAAFHNNSLLTLSLEGSVHIVWSHLFVQSRGKNGISSLPGTNGGSCDPVCLPIIKYNETLAVTSYDELSRSYSIKFYDINIDTLTATKLPRSVTKLSERPYAMNFIGGLSPPIVHNKSALTGPLVSGAVAVLFVLIGTVALVVGLRLRDNHYQRIGRGSSAGLVDPEPEVNRPMVREEDGSGRLQPHAQVTGEGDGEPAEIV